MKLSIPQRNILVVILVFFIQLTGYLYLANRATSLTPPGHVHTMLPVDTYYPDIIRQSKLGRWAIIDNHTTLPAPPVYVHIFFVLAGKVAATCNIDPVHMYEILRITGAILVFITTYMLITAMLPLALHLLAIVFTLIVDTGPFLPTIFALPNLERHFGLPHHLWAEAMGLLLMFTLLKAIKTPSTMSSFAIILLAFFGAVTLPSYFVILTVCVFTPWLLYALATKTAKRSFPPILLAIVMIVLAGLWINYEFGKDLSWGAFVAEEKSWWTTDVVLIPFLQSLFFFYPFISAVLLLAPSSWSHWTRHIRLTVILSAGWSVLPVALIYLSQAPWFPIVNGRIASDVSRVPIGVLSAIGVNALWQKIRHLPHAKTVALVLLILFILLSLSTSILHFSQSMMVQDKAVSREDYSWTLYPTQDLWNGIMALKDVPAFSHIMLNPHVGEIITAYLPLRVYQSAPLSYTDWHVRRGLSYLFYTGEMDERSARELLQTNAISYVFWGPEEKYSLKTSVFYPDLLEVFYQNPEVTIYKVKNL